MIFNMDLITIISISKIVSIIDLIIIKKSLNYKYIVKFKISNII